MQEILPDLGISFDAEGAVLEFLLQLGILYFAYERGGLEILCVWNPLLQAVGALVEIFPCYQSYISAPSGGCFIFYPFKESYT